MGGDGSLLLRRALTVLFCAAALAAALAASAAVSASPPGFIVFVCGEGLDRLCRVPTVGGLPQPIPRPARLPGAIFNTPSLAVDGRRLAYVYRTRAYAAAAPRWQPRMLTKERVDNVALSPRARQVLLLKSVPLCQPASATCPFAGETATIVDWSGGRSRARPTALRDADWLTEQTLVGISARDPHTLLTIPVIGCCGRVLIRSPQWDYVNVASSPDGTTIAASVVTVGGDQPIVLISRARRVAHVLAPTVRGVYADPDWSPDGKWLVLGSPVRGPLHIVRADGTGGIRMIDVRGAQPTWGGRPRLGFGEPDN